MPNCRHDLIADPESVLTSQRDSPVVVKNDCTYVSGFLNYLAPWDIPIADMIEAHAAQHLRHAIVLFQSTVVDFPARAGTSFRAREFTHCCGSLGWTRSEIMRRNASKNVTNQPICQHSFALWPPDD